MESRLADGPPALSLRQGVEPIPGYRLVRRRGRGGFGEVWEAEASGGIHVALKFVHGTPRARAAELRALDFVGGIRHPNLLANFAAWRVGDSLVIGMELADGSLWDRYVRAADEGLGGIPRAELLGYMADAASALDYLNDPRHTVDGRPGVGIQHRDIKPPNILLFGGGAKVADLGMARALEGDQTGHTGTWTFPYAAPEFFKGRTHRQSDQYGLAATYCQLRSGRLPFEGGAASVTAGHLYGKPDLKGLPEAERPILERALAKEPADRWPDCRAFVETLRALDPSQAPEILPRPEEPAEDIPRHLRSSTGFEEAPRGALGDFDDTPLPSWKDFESASDPGSLMNTAETTAILPDPRPGVGPAPRPRPRRRGFGRSVASILAVALAVAAPGVHPSSDRDPAPAISPLAPSKPVASETVVPVAEPGPSDEAVPAPPPLLEVEPAPARAAEEIKPASPTSVHIDTPEETPATRSDLVPRRRARPTFAAPKDEEGPPPSPPPPPDPARAEASRAEALGRDHLASNALDRAIAEFDRAIRLRPAFVSAYFHRALARHRASHYPEALADYSEAIRLRPGEPSLFIARGQAHHDLGAYDRAVADFTEAIRLKPDEPSAFLRRGIARYRSGDYAGAVADLDQALQLDPKNHRAREFRDDSLARLGGRVRDGSAPRKPSPTRPAPGTLPASTGRPAPAS